MTTEYLLSLVSNILSILYISPLLGFQFRITKKLKFIIKDKIQLQHLWFLRKYFSRSFASFSHLFVHLFLRKNRNFAKRFVRFKLYFKPHFTASSTSPFPFPGPHLSNLYSFPFFFLPSTSRFDPSLISLAIFLPSSLFPLFFLLLSLSYYSTCVSNIFIHIDPV